MKAEIGRRERFGRWGLGVVDVFRIFAQDGTPHGEKNIMIDR